ncbi:unnamed protein product [Bursaphelenchus xylophilus]|uniref:(pine wood nematode) hypothetical protein n=1 Tax=Bursaphelenchus xylophilus TaxID=6326 RepID=A0A7I8WUJ2_BURXY|nr:unnamed protein product [Bursaphelenchus xylophilus]CAG9116762.1 unnamed protein product [Bursaphelenchus xylophilus]
MAAEKRKLMVEIDKCFKKIDEGLELFEDMIKKLNEATADNMKDKCQEDLKKEIKKLQRLRDQVKNWQGSPEIKDKEKLNTYRRLIETKMELFKDIERENKTKPHSKIGLSIEEKVDPKEKEKAEVIEWLKAKIRCIQDEIDRTESKLEVLSGENGGEKKKKNKKGGRKNGSDDETDVLKKHLERVNFHMDNLEYEDVQEKLMEALDMYVEALDPENDDDPLDLEPDDIYEELGLNEYIDQLGKVNLPPIDEEKIIAVEKTKPKDIQKPTSASKSTGSMPHISSTPKSSFGSHHSILGPTPPKPAGSSLPSTTSEMKYSAVIKVANAAAGSDSSQNKKPEKLSEPVRPQPTLCRSDNPGLSNSSMFSDSNRTVVNNDSIETNTPIVEMKENIEPMEEEKPELNDFPRAEDFFSAYMTPTDQVFQQLPPPVGQPQPSDYFTRNTIHLPQSVVQQPRTVKINPFSAYGVTTNTAMSALQRKATKCIEQAAKHIPIPADHLRVRSYFPHHKSNDCSPLWMMRPLEKMDTIEFYTRLEKETLFFIFYYMEGTYAQTLASKALKYQSWRYHKKFLMWFQRKSDPRVMTADYESGSYFFFDYEKWTIRTRDNFIFEYKYLEQNPYIN